MKTSHLLACTFALCSTAVVAQEINLSGFGSAHVTQKLGGNSTTEYYSENTDYLSFSKFGLNASSNFGSKFSFQSQLLVSGRRQLAGSDKPQWDMYANWLFLAYRPTENFRFRIGRQLFPAWMVSEYIDVGYMYPWTETPHAVFELSPFKSLNGIAADYGFMLTDSMKLTVTVFGGNETVRIPLAQGGNEVNDYGSILGSEVVLSGNGHKLRAMGSYNHVKTTTSSSTYESDSVRTLTTGYRYDAKKIMLYAEWGLREGGNADIIPANENPRGIAEKFNKRTSAGYVTAGYWFGNVLPHITASQTKWNTGTVTGTQDMYSLGVNVKVEEGVMFKTNVSYSISNNGPAHMETEGDATTAVAGFDVVF